MAELEKFKLSTLTWDGGKDEDSFFIFLENFGNIARSTASGPLLEDMLDSKLRRTKVARGSIPSYILNDPDFAVPMNTTEAEGGAASPAAETASVSGESSATGAFSLGQHHTAYANLPKEAKRLDATLYNIFKLCIKGSKQALVQCVSFPSYVQAAIVLVKHMDISRMRRIMAAFHKLDSLSYTGDTLQFQSNFLACKRELDNCRATVTHLIMCRLMKAFEGRSKTVQFKIAEDFNRLDLDDPNINLYDLVQNYCADLATVGDSKPHRVAAVVCSDCHNEGHEAEDCPKRKQRETNEANRLKNLKLKADRATRQNKAHANLTCHTCGKVGHISPNCPEKKKSVNLAHSPPSSSTEGAPIARLDEAQAQAVAQQLLSGFTAPTPVRAPQPPPPASAPVATVGLATPSVANTASLPPEVLSAMVSQLRANTSGQFLVVPSEMVHSVPEKYHEDRECTSRIGPMVGLSDTSSMSESEMLELVTKLRRESSNPVCMVGSDRVDQQSAESLEQTHTAVQHALQQARAQVQEIMETAENEKIHLSLCGGMGTDIYVMRMVGAKFTRSILVEKDETKRVICNNLNPPEAMDNGGVDLTWHTRVEDITESDIVALGPGNIARLDFEAPCKDFAPSRLLPSKYGGKLNNPRPGLQGKHGRVLLSCLEVYAWVMKHNPECEVWSENLCFDDMPHDWKIVCLALGDPIKLDAADYSCTRRVRAYRTSMSLPSLTELTAGFGPMNPNQFMGPGRTLEPYVVEGKTTVRTIGASWIGDPMSPKADTSVPVVVHDIQHPTAQHLHSTEAEMLLGFHCGATGGRAVTEIDRLRALGDSVDVRVSVMMNRFSKHATIRIDGPPNVLPRAQSGTSSREQTALSTLLAARAQGGPNALVELLQQVPMNTQLELLHILKRTTSPVMYAGSVLDSGSSKHLHTKVQVTHADDVTSLTGFDSSSSPTWTQGNGYLPLIAKDMATGEKRAFDLYDSDKLSTVTLDILSMGKMIRANWEFHFESADNLIAIPPCKQSRFKVELGMDDILRLPHELREGAAATPLPVPNKPVPCDAPVLSVRRVPEEVNALMLHDIFLHRGMEKIFRTLEHTVGYIAVRLPDPHCSWCAQAKSQRRGLHTHNTAIVPVDAEVPVGAAYQLLVLVAQSHVDIYDDDDHDDTSSDEDDENKLEIHYLSPTTGRALGTQPVPRFDLDKLRPFEVMFVDNKDYEHDVRGGWKYTLGLVCIKSTARFKVDIVKKTENGLAFRRMAVLNGVQKLPYHCRVYSDGCGSMMHVEVAAVMLGIDHAYIPPHEQSLNEAEKIFLNTWDDTAALMLRSGAPLRLFAECVSFALYVHLRMATTASRQFKTPLEIIRGTVPDIRKLHRFFTAAFVCVPRQKRKQMAKHGFVGRAESGRLLGFRSPFSSTFRVLLSNNRVVHSVNVTFDDSNCNVETPLPSAPPTNATIEMQIHPAAQHLPIEGGTAPPAQQSSSPIADAGTPSSPAMQSPYVSISPLADSLSPPIYTEDGQQYFDLDHPSQQEFWYNEEPPAPRPRPNYSFLVSEQYDEVEKAHRLPEMDRAEGVTRVFALIARATSRSATDHGALREAGMFLALLAMKDLNWKKALEGERSAEVIESFHKERDSLLGTVLEIVDEDDPQYLEKHNQAISGRYLLDLRRSGKYKTRGVKHGFKEDKASADGPGFNYYSHVVRLYTFRIAFFRPN